MKQTLASEFLTLKKQLLHRSYFSMNEPQSEVIFSVEGPLMVLAGAGSGKTTAIINRVSNIINFGNAYFSKETPENLNQKMIDELKNIFENGGNAFEVKDLIQVNPANPENILAITFTNKAANELKIRLEKTLQEKSKKIWASTFHSLCARILRIYAEKLGFKNDFTVYDSDESLKLIKDCQKQLNTDEKILTHKIVAREISSAKDKLIDYNQFKTEAGQDYLLSSIAEVYELYQKRLVEANAMDFDDLIFNTIRLFKSNPQILKIYQEKFRYIMVDEYQDTNPAQHTLIKEIGKKYRNVCVVGDDDQSIYKFRGATVENIINFEKTYKGAKVIRLEQNYRSTKTILDAANSIIENNSKRKSKKLWTQNEKGDKIGVHTAYSEHDEANYIAEIIQDKVARGAKFSDFAVLYRMNTQSNVIEKIFMKCGIPYRMLGGTRFYDRREIRDMIAYLSVINNPLDEIRLRRIINQPRRSIGERTISQAVEVSLEKNKDLLTVIRECEKNEVLKRVASKLKVFSSLIDGLRNAYINNNLSISEIYDLVLQKTGYIDFLKSEGDNPESRIENVRELASNIIKYEEENGEKATLAGFLEEVALLSEVDNYDEKSDAVIMMTMHSAKGLEFPTVFLPGFEEGIFPGIRAFSSEEEMEEERRLAYVGVTRAKGKLYILNSDSRMIFGTTSHNKASRFLMEIPVELIEKTKSRDWKKLEKGEEEPKLAQDLRLKSAASAKYFGNVSAKGSQKILLDKIVAGGKVTSSVFGKGTVISSVPMGNDSLLEIDFEKVGVKKLMQNYANLSLN